MEETQVAQGCRGKLTAGDNPTKTLKVGEIIEASIFSNNKIRHLQSFFNECGSGLAIFCQCTLSNQIGVSLVRNQTGSGRFRL